MTGIINYINAYYNPRHNCIDITHYDGYILRINCNKAEDNLKTTPNSQGLLNALAIDDSLKYARLVLNNEMADWIWAMENLNM